MKYFITIILFSLVTACKPLVSADIYTRDIIDVAQNGTPLEIPIRMGLPIQNEKKCDDDKNKMLPALQKYGKGVKFISCKDVKNQMYDLLFVEMVGKIVKASATEVTSIDGMFGLSVSQQGDGNLTVHFLKTDNVDEAVKEIDNNYQFQSIELEDIDLTLRLNNDLRKTIQFEIDSSFVNNNPVDAPTIFDLPRRGTKEIVPSNVRSKSIIKSGKAKFARIIIN